MKKYRVTFTVQGYCEVEAEDEEAALNLAVDMDLENEETLDYTVEERKS